MAAGYKARGGVNPLNFKVVGSDVAPTNPKENTIWINTDQKVTFWVFSSKEPSNPVEGMVWFKVGSQSLSEFNALKKNTLMVYPGFAKQYLSGVWVNKDARCYQGGAWKPWWSYIFYDYGKEFLEFSGSIASLPKGFDAEDDAAASMAIQRNADNIKIYNGTTSPYLHCGIAYYNKKIDLTDFSTLTFKGQIVDDTEYNSHVGLGIWSSFGSYVDSNRVASITGKQSGEMNLDISGLKGEHYIGFWSLNHNQVSRYIVMNYLKLS